MRYPQHCSPVPGRVASAPENDFRLRATATTMKCGRSESLLRQKGLSAWAQCRRQIVVRQLRPTKAECSPSPVKEVPLDRTPWDCRQALTCCLSNQNQTKAQLASPSMGPSKPDKEAPGLQPTGKGGRSNPMTQTDNHMLYTTQT